MSDDSDFYGEQIEGDEEERIDLMGALQRSLEQAREQRQQPALLGVPKPMPDPVRQAREEFAETCCGKCAGASCYVDQVLGN